MDRFDKFFFGLFGLWMAFIIGVWVTAIVIVILVLKHYHIL